MEKTFSDQEYRIHSVVFGEDAINIEWWVKTGDGPGYSTFHVTALTHDLISSDENLSYDYKELYSSALDLLWHWRERMAK